VDKIRAFFNVFKRLAGVNVRYNRVLRTVKDWAETLNQFLVKYGLEENTGTDKLLANSGDVKFELTEIVYKGRPLIAKAGKLKNKKVAPMIAGIIDSVESIRRYLINPALQRERLKQGVINLRLSLETLQKNLAEIEYL
jgi:K+-sensing histidine kinase KdpD